MPKRPLKAKPTNNQLAVHKGGGRTLSIVDLEVGESLTPQDISWELDYALRNATFKQFAWINPGAAAGIFEIHPIPPHGKSITITAKNGPTAKKGSHPYVIEVKVNGTVYSTDTGRPRHPIIINK